MVLTWAKRGVDSYDGAARGTQLETRQERGDLQLSCRDLTSSKILASSSRFVTLAPSHENENR